MLLRLLIPPDANLDLLTTNVYRLYNRYFHFPAVVCCANLRTGQPEDRATQGCDPSAELEAEAGAVALLLPSSISPFLLPA
jgi:hypothetical protein